MKTMTKIILILATTGLAFSLSACTSGTANTKRGAVAGGLIGAAAGGIIGHQSGRGLEGAALADADSGRVTVFDALLGAHGHPPCRVGSSFATAFAHWFRPDRVRVPRWDHV